MIFTIIATVFDIVGASTMALGVVVAVIFAGREWRRSRSAGLAYRRLRDMIGKAILLGLEVLVAADLVRTVTSTPSLTDALVLAIIVLVRTILSMTLQIEVSGQLPWRRGRLEAATAPQGPPIVA